MIFSDRVTAAECAYGLDILVNDESYYVRVGSVLVGNGGIEFDFRCDYEFYYEKTIDQYTSEDESWDEDTDILIKCLGDVDNDIDGDNVWVEIYFNDHDFDAN